MKTWISKPDTVIISAMIQAFALRGEVEKCMDLFTEIDAYGEYPTEVTYTNMILACAMRPDYYNEAFEYLKKMKDFGYVPDEKCLNVLLLSSSKAGDVSTAEIIFDQLMKNSITN